MIMDTQQIGIIGKHILIANLTAADLEVAEPIRDHGIDLIVFRDGKKDSKKGGKFAACPIQLKTSTEKAFELYRKYDRFGELRIVYVWNAKNVWNTEKPSAQIYCLTYKQAEDLLKAGGHAEKASWKKGNHWVTTRPSEELKKRLEEYRVKSPKEWPDRLGLAISP